jgi:hypothetical protein
VHDHARAQRDGADPHDADRDAGGRPDPGGVERDPATLHRHPALDQQHAADDLREDVRVLQQGVAEGHDRVPDRRTHIGRRVPEVRPPTPERVPEPEAVGGVLGRRGDLRGGLVAGLLDRSLRGRQHRDRLGAHRLARVVLQGGAPGRDLPAVRETPQTCAFLLGACGCGQPVAGLPEAEGVVRPQAGQHQGVGVALDRVPRPAVRLRGDDERLGQPADRGTDVVGGGALPDEHPTDLGQVARDGVVGPGLHEQPVGRLAQPVEVAGEQVLGTAGGGEPGGHGRPVVASAASRASCASTAR